jgi:tripartite-type tricarboxylate transporter receptor subunit TctC
MSKFRLFAAAALLHAALLGAASAVWAQSDFPNRPVRIIEPFPAGGTIDASARMMAPILGNRWKQSVVIENRPGGFQIVGANVVSGSPPDGYNLLMGAQNLAFEHLVNKDTTFNAGRDLSPIIALYGAGLMIYANATVPATNLRDFAAYVKANPGKVFKGWGGGTAPAIDEFLHNYGADISPIMYKGGADASRALFANEVQVMISAPLEIPLEATRSGRVHPLAYSGTERHPLFPDVPTLKEASGMDAQYQYWIGIWGPPGMPAPLANSVYAAMKEAVQAPEVRDKLEKTMGVQVFAWGPDEMTRDLARQIKEVEALLAKGYKFR